MRYCGKLAHIIEWDRNLGQLHGNKPPRRKQRGFLIHSYAVLLDVVPAMAKPAPDLIRGNSVRYPHSRLAPPLKLRRHAFAQREARQAAGNTLRDKSPPGHGVGDKNRLSVLILLP
jgi:hypothetical protein